YERATWNAPHVNADYLKLADAFQRSMAEVIDAERLVYVAGYGEKTPYRIRVAAPKGFEYQTTTDGDGRVPHELGILPNVTTLYVRESHGALPKNESVRDSLDELFDTGKSGGLLSSIPRQRAMQRGGTREAWQSADEIEPPSDEAQIAAKYRALPPNARANQKHDDQDLAQAAVDEARVMRGWTGAPDQQSVEVVRVRRGGSKKLTTPMPTARRARGTAAVDDGATAARTTPLLSVQVVWGDITLDEEGDVYVAGHYESVLPQAAEAALDVIVSSQFAPRGPNENDAAYAARRLAALEGRLVHGLTKRGAIRGSLGEVYFFPWADWALESELRSSWIKKRRLVAIAGMGYSGSFSANELQRLSRQLVFALQRLPGAETLSTVLIGAGNGNLRVRSAVDSYIRGMLDGLGERDVGGHPMKLRIVESRLGKAIQIERELRKLAKDMEERNAGVLKVLPRAVTPRTMSFDEKDAYALALASASWRYTMSASDDASDLAPLNEAIQDVLTAAHASANDFTQVRDALKRLWGEVLEQRRIASGGLPDNEDESLPVTRALEALGTLEVGFQSETTRPDDATTRLGVVRERVAGEMEPARVGGAPNDAGAATSTAAPSRLMTSVSALTNTAVIPKRPSNVDWGLIVEAIARLTDPSPELVPRYGADLATYLLPRDFRDLLQRAEPIVFEVDRTTATVPWEMICNPNDSEQEAIPLALSRQVARQLRTEYSPPPSLAPARGRQLRILVIGDPGSPNEGNSLPGARNEALSVVQILEELRDHGANLEVTAMIGAPSVKNDARLARYARASRFDVLSQLRRGNYDVLHYCGHGDFDPQDPTRAGWVFEGGLLTSYELERIDIAPPLVVANACLTGLISQRTSNGGTTNDGGRDQDLVPSLADEFFRRGVHTYIGTAWYVNDVGAAEFARAFYHALLDPAGVRLTSSQNSECVDGTVGGAMHYARRVLKTHELEYDALWAAYHHYGDPTQRISLDITPREEAEPPKVAALLPSAASKRLPRKAKKTVAKAGESTTASRRKGKTTRAFGGKR
ncbi:MAG: CHAT domain-containing protein, partial [Gemmatimonadaceae bacterium]